MNITDELRAYVRGHSWKSLTAIADRIDAEHERELDYVRNLASEGLAEQWNSGYDVGFASADDWLEQHEGAMAEHGWYRVLDADKQPIRIGDELDSDHCEDGTVVGLQFFEEANGVLRVFIAIRPHGWDTPTWRSPDSYRHHHKPTLEDVLAEFALEIDPSADIAVTGAETIKKFAAKLQLKEPNE